MNIRIRQKCKDACISKSLRFAPVLEAMKSLVLICLILGTLHFSACAPEHAAEQNDIEPGSIAEMINNPISADTPQDTSLMARIRFENTIYNFGEIFEGDIEDHIFRFTNTGKVPLVIANAKSTCGCTASDWPKYPIPPGESSEIKVKFNSSNKPGSQNRAITILSNSYPQEVKLYMRGNVISKEDNS